jgi:hypothetical protein
VQAKRARLEFVELIGGFRGQLSRFNQFLQFRIHPKSNKLRRTRRGARENWNDGHRWIDRSAGDANAMRLRRQF